MARARPLLRLITPRFIGLYFDSPPPLGDRISFVPPWIVPQWKLHPVVRLLRELACLCRSEEVRECPDQLLTPS
jgi:hypothetical protein